VVKDEESPGWAAIDAALGRIYAREPLFHLAVPIRVRKRWGGPRVLEGTSGYRVADPPHLHLVTYGLSELHQKVGADPRRSGWGIELTIRVAGEWKDERPLWAASILDRMANQVDERRDPFQPGDRIDVGGPLQAGSRSAITALALAVDPQLGAIETPHGGVQFLQAVGITADELALGRRWNMLRVLETLAEGNPLLITDLERPSILEDPIIRGRLERLAQMEGAD
jgi:hypothetical protein